MKLALFCTIAVTCVVGLALADFDDVYGSVIGGGYGAASYGLGHSMGMGYGHSKVSYMPVYPGAGKGAGSGGLLGLIGLLFILFFLFGNQNSNDNFIFLNSSK